MKKRSECNCPCHQPGVQVMHIMPCCYPDPLRDVRIEARFTEDDWVVEVVNGMTELDYEAWFIKKMEEFYGTE